MAAAKLTKATQGALKANTGLQQKDRTNLLFYITMDVACELAGKDTLKPEDIAKIDLAKLTDAVIADSLARVSKLYSNRGGDDGAAKGTDLIADLKGEITSRLNKPKGQQAAFDLSNAAKSA
ncbi:MAG TPA: hypothetical protein VFS88_07725 [Micavibrio sp.]|nr:hypothetical protein [Micavibrio sp.]